MNDALKHAVWEANVRLVREGLVLHTWGNVSAVDRVARTMVIKPSGVPYDQLQPDQMVTVSLDTGKAAHGSLRPSSDTPTHLVLYRRFSGIGGIAHTHSMHATAWAQATRNIPILGTTHADYWRGEIPCTRRLRPTEIKNNYEENTGHIIVETFRNLNPLEVPAVLVASHGAFAWGRDAAEAVQHAVVLEYVAQLARETLIINAANPSLDPLLGDFHFARKHGPKSSYGQNSST
jgi:L-ribulose-5-phosphate 4-epimerase